METITTVIPQAVYTDPMIGGQAGGNCLICSKSMQLADANQLNQLEGILDPQLEIDYPGPYYSFLPLRSGNYAFIQRFSLANDFRRGVKRLVVHSLVLSKEFIDRHQWDIEGIRAYCRFFYTKTSLNNAVSYSIPMLQVEVGKRGLTGLPDLYCFYNAEFPQRALESFIRKQQYLLDNCGWNANQLHNILLNIGQALQTDKPISLPRDSAYEQISALIRTILPPLDRRHIAWTTFPWPGVTWQLINTPNSLTIDSQINTAESTTSNLATIRSLIEQHVPATAATLNDQQYIEQLMRLRAGLWDYRLSIKEPGQIQAWLHFCSSDYLSIIRKFTSNGSNDFIEFTNVLQQLRTIGWGTSKISPWLQPHLILQGICLTGLNLIKNATALATKSKISELRQILDATATLNALTLNPISLLELATAAPKFEIALVAVALELVANITVQKINHLTIYIALDKNRTLFETVKKSYSGLLALVQAELAFVILSKDERSSEEQNHKSLMILLWTVINKHPDLLDDLIPRFLSTKKTARRLLQLFWELANKLNHQQYIQQLLAQNLVTHLCNHPEDASEEKFSELIITLQHCPGPVLISCLQQWKKNALEIARVALQKRLSNHDDHGLNTPIVLSESLREQVEHAWSGGHSVIENWAAPVARLCKEWSASDITAHSANQLAINWWKYLAQSVWTVPLSEGASENILNLLPDLPPVHWMQWKQVIETWADSVDNICYRPGEEFLLQKLLKFNNKFNLIDHEKIQHELQHKYFIAKINSNPNDILYILKQWDLWYRTRFVQTDAKVRDLIALLNRSTISAEALVTLLCVPLPITLYNALMHRATVSSYAPKIIAILLLKLEDDSVKLPSELLHNISNYCAGSLDTSARTQLTRVLDAKGELWFTGILETSRL